MQTKLGSFVESWANIFVGFGVNFSANLLILPLFGFTGLTLGKNLAIGILYTVISLVRSYVLRRWFNSLRFGNAEALTEVRPDRRNSGTYPDNNPKAAIGALKVPLHLVPPGAKHFLALALEDGAKKYGPYNWRDAGISISTYKAACDRHWDAFWDGEDNADDSKLHHIAHALACCAILLDAMAVGKLIDDRPKKGAAPRLQAEYAAAKKAAA